MSWRPISCPDGDGLAGDLGLYGPRSEAWRLNREAMLLLGAGPRALLLQLAHPAVAAGVAEHSDFRADPWRRLAGTLRSYLTIVYGTTTSARAEIRRLNALHRGIAGVGYSARDPELSLWVHATLVDSTIAVADAWLEPVPAARRASVLRRDPSDRPGVRHPGRPPARGSRRVRRLLGGHARTGWSGQGLARRARARRGRAAVHRSRRWSRHWPGSRQRPTPGRSGHRSACCRRRSARTTGCAGGPASGSCRRGSSPAGVPGARCSRSPSGRCRRRWPRTVAPGCARQGPRPTLSRAAGTAARRASRRDRSASPSRAHRAGSRS